MSTGIEMPHQLLGDCDKASLGKSLSTQQMSTNALDKNQHPLHQYDWTVMSKFLDSCVSKLKEQHPKWKPSEWTNMTPMPSHLTPEQRSEWPNPMVMSQKQRVYEAFARLARETGEPMILMPSFDYGDILNFERFLQALKKDGVNAIGKYKQYLSNKDMRKFEIDLVVIHAKYGILLVEVKDCDHLDNKRRSRAKMQLNSARSCFETMGRLIVEAKGWSTQEATIPITEFIALPNVQVRPETSSSAKQSVVPPTTTTTGSHDNSSTSATTSTSTSSARRQIQFLIRSDMENSGEFAKWWTKYVVEPKQALQKQLEAENKPNKFDLTILNWMTGLINCIRNNSIMPVVYPESGKMFSCRDMSAPTGTAVDEQHKTTTTEEDKHAPALNLHGEFFHAEHESVRALSKVVVASKDIERIRKVICLQTLWLLLNDSQKKISVVCSELNKPYYEEFFARQRKLYNNLNNVRFYTDVHSCAVNTGSHTLKKDGEIWFFDSAINGSLSDVMERVKDLNAYWIFTTQEEQLSQHKHELESMSVRVVKMDEKKQHHEHQQDTCMSGVSLKFPLRLQCDLLIIGDIVDSANLKQLYNCLDRTTVTNQAMQYQNVSNYQSHQYQQPPQKQKLGFVPSKKFKQVKFIRGGTIDNLRNSLKMHDSVQAQVVILHVGDEDLFKTRNSITTIERIKELASLVKEYCPKSFIVLSTLMRRMSRTENTVSSEVNRGIMNFCKQTRETSNFFYMLNNHFEPDYHTQGGRVLVNNGLRLFMDNILFVVDYFMVRNNKQH